MLGAKNKPYIKEARNKILWRAQGLTCLRSEDRMINFEVMTPLMIFSVSEKQ